MTDTDTNPRIGYDDPAWYFLAELSPGEISADHRDELMHGLWVQTLRELGMPFECVENIHRTLAGLARDAGGYFKQESMEVPGTIRLFCQKKMIDDANSTKIRRPCATGLAGEQIKMIEHSTAKMNGGWGYFVIERGGNGLAGSPAHSWKAVDLYLYKEGE